MPVTAIGTVGSDSLAEAPLASCGTPPTNATPRPRPSSRSSRRAVRRSPST
jgi:hypothetical protein